MTAGQKTPGQRQLSDRGYKVNESIHSHASPRFTNSAAFELIAHDMQTLACLFSAYAFTDQ